MRRSLALLLAILPPLLLTGCRGLAAPEAPAATPIPQSASPYDRAPKATATPPPTSTPQPGVEGEVHIWLDWDPDELKSLELVIENFERQYPGIKVGVSYSPPDQLASAFTAAVLDGQMANLLLAPASWGPALWEEGLIRDLSLRLTSDLHEAILTRAWNQVAYQEKVLGLPLEIKGIVLYRNRNLVESPAETIGALVARAESLREEGLAKGAALDMGFINSGSNIQACGGDLSFRSEGPIMDEESGLCWLTLLSRLGASGPVTFNSDEDLDLFLNRDAAWIMDTTDRLHDLDLAMGAGTLAVDPWPFDETTNTQMEGFLWSENLYFSANADFADTEAAWVLATFLVSPQAQLTLADIHGAGHLPVLANIRLDTDLQTRARQELLNGFPYPLSSRLSRYIEQLENAARLVTEQKGDPEFALAVGLEDVEGLFPTPTPGALPSPNP